MLHKLVCCQTAKTGSAHCFVKKCVVTLCVVKVLGRTVTVYQADSKGAMQQVIKETVPQRIFTYQELKLLASASGYDLYAAYGDMLMDAPISDSDAVRMVLVLRRL